MINLTSHDAGGEKALEILSEEAKIFLQTSHLVT